MTQTTKVIIGVIVVIVVILIALAFYKQFKAPSKEVLGPIKIGFIAPLTGDAAAYGESERDGVVIAEEEINKAGGVNGRPIQVIYEDGKCTGKDAASAAQKLINIDKVKFIIGGACSGEVFGAAPIAETNKVILFSPSATNPKIADIGDFVFRNIPSDNVGGKELATLVYRDYKKTAVISENTEYAQGLGGAFIDNYTALGGEVVFDESFVTEVKDFRSILSKMKAANPEAIFINPQTGGAASRIAKQARELGLNQQFYLAYLSGPEYVESGPTVEGSIIVDVPGLDSENAKAVSFLGAYQEKYNKQPNYPFFAGASYDILYLLVDGIRQYGEDSEKVRDYLYNLTSYSGTVGGYSFDDKGEVVGIKFVVKQVVEGKVVEME